MKQHKVLKKLLVAICFYSSNLKKFLKLFFVGMHVCMCVYVHAHASLQGPEEVSDISVLRPLLRLDFISGWQIMEAFSSPFWQGSF